MTTHFERAGKRIGALLLTIILATPAWAQTEATPVAPSQKEMDALMDMARQMMGMLPQMMKSLQALEKELDRMDMAPYESLGLTSQQKDQADQIQKSHEQVQAELAVKERDETTKLRELLSAERPNPEAVAQQQMRVDEVRRQRLVERITARNRLYDILTEQQRQRLRLNEPAWLKAVAPLRPVTGTGASISTSGV